MTKQDALDRLQKQADVYMIYNRNSLVPYVCCDTDDTMLDYASLYFEETGAADKAKELSGNGQPVVSMKIKRELLQPMLTDMLYYGIDAIRFFDGADAVMVETHDMVRLDPNAKDPKGHPYLINQSAQISMIYLVQELSRSASDADSGSLRSDAQTEVLANIANSSFYIAFTKMDANAKRPEGAPEGEYFAPALLKDKSGKLMLPIFTDINELKKAFSRAKDQKIPYKAFEYRKLIEALVPENSSIESVIINPAGVKLPLLRDAARKLTKDPRFIKSDESKTQA